MPTFFCPQCWSEVPEGAARCAACGADLSAADAESYDEKLIRALHHPDAATVMRAVHLLGARRLTSAVDPLRQRGARDADPYLRAAIADALRAIGTPEAAQILEELKEDPSVIVREATSRRRSTTINVTAPRPEPGETRS